MLLLESDLRRSPLIELHLLCAESTPDPVPETLLEHKQPLELCLQRYYLEWKGFLQL